MLTVSCLWVYFEAPGHNVTSKAVKRIFKDLKMQCNIIYDTFLGLPIELRAELVSSFTPYATNAKTWWVTRLLFSENGPKDAKYYTHWLQKK